jgi:hypothetical protein
MVELFLTRDRFLLRQKVAEFAIVGLHAVIRVQRYFHVGIVPQVIVKFSQLDPFIFRCEFFLFTAPHQLPLSIGSII